MAGNLLENLCPIYKKLLGETLILVEYAERPDLKREILIKFSKKHFLLPEFWRKFVSPYGKRPSKRWIQIPEKDDTYNILHYYFLKFHTTRRMEQVKAKNIQWHLRDGHFYRLEVLENYEETLKIVESFLNFPHEYLITCYKKHKYYGAKPIPATIKNNYKKSLYLLQEFRNAYNDEKWLKCVKKLENEEAIVANIELRLGDKTSCTNKEIWKYYIKYLRDRDSTAMLEVYLRYCRFFISDIEMVKEYRNEIERIGSLHEEDVSIFWIDTLEWELDFGDDLKTAYSLLKGAFESKTKKLIILKCVSTESILKALSELKRLPYRSNFEDEKYDDESIDEDDDCPAKRRRIQVAEPCYYNNKGSYSRLSIPTDMAKYILTNATASLLTKLYHSSPYFYAILSVPICHRLFIQKSVVPRYFQQSLFVSDPNMYFLGNQKLYLSNNLCFCSHGISTNFSSFISKLYKCDAKHITLCNLTLTTKELEFLVSSGKVKSFKCRSLRVLNEDQVSINNSQIQDFIESFGNKIGDIRNKPNFDFCEWHNNL